MTPILKYTSTTILLLLLGACASTVSYDYDTTYDFSQLKSFTVSSANAGDDLMDKRLDEIITRNLTAKQLLRDDSNADGVVTHSLSDGMQPMKEKPRMSIGGSTGGWSSGAGVGLSIPIGGNNITYALKIAVTDNSGRLIWQVEDTFELGEGSNPEQKSAALADVNNKILAQFPPSTDS
jgi:hypothetical protein